ncbi:methyltransferase domain-containing protein [Pseudidiomarina salinarum]|uniref:methyltransferase domain-containing protein n=1 Tax=Pseudidiomarina salinarum TaxID=435908 RepID=UPI00068D4645|nr:methyltransferase domain-containing protein [Pseudidiomarina salinarum]RUO70425.1 SAM-dependent methyltransferase [Pseudidiomarina salinarum]
MQHSFSDPLSRAYDKTRVARQFSKAAVSYSQHDYLQRLCGEQLLQRLPEHSEVLVDLGCGPASMTSALQSQCGYYLGLDIAAGMLQQAQSQCNAAFAGADMDLLPLQADSVDTVFSNLTLQWSNDLHATLSGVLKTLKPGGSMVFSTILAGSMTPLTRIFAEVDSHPHSNTFLSADVIRNVLTKLPEASWDLTELPLRVSYSSLRDMLRDLKGIGANYTARDPQGLFTRRRFALWEAATEKYREADGKLYLYWHIGLISLRKGVD